MSETHAKQVVGASNFNSPKSRLFNRDYKKYCLGLPGWCPCSISDSGDMTENLQAHEGGEPEVREQNKIESRFCWSIPVAVQPKIRTLAKRRQRR